MPRAAVVKTKDLAPNATVSSEELLQENKANIEQNSNNPYPDPKPAPAKVLKTMAESKPTPKKKHVCTLCERGFTTSGHLARHSRVHTGERNHKCPFPGCDTRCSRQDNLQQHYRIHLSPGSRRNSTRSSASRAARGSNAVQSTVNLASLGPPPEQPPPLVHAMSDAGSATRANSASASPPPPLEPATARIGLYNNNNNAQPESPPLQDRHQNSRTASPERFQPAQQQQYSHEMSHLHTIPPTNHYRESYYPRNYQDNEFAAPGNYSSVDFDRSHSPVSSMSSRHSISHISHPQVFHSHSQSPAFENAYGQQQHQISSQHSSPMSDKRLSSSPPPATNNSGSYYNEYQPQLHNQLITPGSRYQSPAPVLAPMRRNEYDDRRGYPPMQPDYVYHHQYPPSISKSMGNIGTLVQ